MEYTVWADNYGASPASYGMGDHNHDGSVTDADYTLWADRYDPTVDCRDYRQYVIFQANGDWSWGLSRYIAVSLDRLEEIWLQSVYVDLGERGELVPEPLAAGMLLAVLVFARTRGRGEYPS